MRDQPSASLLRRLAQAILALSCSAALAETQIIGGQTTSQWPAVGAVIITVGDTFGICTGTAITPRWVLTAAHCVDPAVVGPSPSFQFAITTDINAPGGTAYAVDTAAFDPAFNPVNLSAGHDTGLLHIKDVDLPVLPFKLNGKRLSSDIIGSFVVAIGYGVTSGGGADDSGVKRIAQLRIDSLDNALISAAAPPPGTCSGDSGGPVFIYDDDGFPVIIATTSFGGINCGLGGSFWRVDAALDYISSIVDPGPCLLGESCDGIQRGDFDAPLGLADGCYVRAGASGAHNGTSWSDAYPDLQSALGSAVCKHLRVAQGIYKPATNGDATASFAIASGVRVYGGFAGTGITRDPAAYPAVLSGDVDNNDTMTNGVITDWTHIAGQNSYHVVMLDGTTTPIGADTILDGLTITGGAAAAVAPNDRGGALYCNGAGASSACSPTIDHVMFSGNFAGTWGGGLYAGGTNGGNSSPRILDSTFLGNYAGNGGAAFHDTGATGGTSSPTYANDTFTTNYASSYGGALYHSITSGSGTLTLTNTTFTGNSSLISGGALAIYGVGGAPVVSATNAILWGDTSPNSGREELVIVADSPTFTNSIVMGSGGSGAGWNALLGIDFDGSLIDGGGNLDADPLLSTLQDNGGPTPTFLPLAGSPAIETGLDGACNAGFVNALDQRGVARPQDAHCDIGAVEAEP